MSMKQTALILVFLAAGMLLVSSCKDEVPSVLNPTSINVSFGKITVSSSDQRTPSEWSVVLGTLVSTLNDAYDNADYKGDYETVGRESGGIRIVLDDNLPKNWEVKRNDGGTHGTLYIKTGSISSISAIDYDGAVGRVEANINGASTTKATPTKNGTLLALA